MQLTALFSCFCLALIAICPNAVLANIRVIYAVNAGGHEHTDQHGIHYEADPLHGRIGTASDYGNHLLEVKRVPQQDDVLFRTERYHTGTFGYNLPLDGDGEYALIMKFCEVYFNEPNKKVFDVVLNNQHTVVEELDIYNEVGHGAAHEEHVYFNVKNGRIYYKDEVSEVRNGVIRLDFIKGKYDNPKINAFALLKGDVSNLPQLPPNPNDMLPMDTDDMNEYEDQVITERQDAAINAQTTQQRWKKVDELDAESAAPQFENDDDEHETLHKVRKTSGPRHPNPYSMDDSSVMLPVFIAIGAFIPLLFCLCKL